MLVLLIIGIIYLMVMVLFLFGSMQLPMLFCNPSLSLHLLKDLGEEGNTSKDSLTEKEDPSVRFTVVIPFRNEAKNLPKLLESIKKLNYPPNLYEIIFIDDGSKDNSINIISESLKNQNITFDIILNKRFSASPKKDAITTAVKLSKFEWILTTDADCSLPINWLCAYDLIIKKRQPLLVAGPICFESNGSLLQEFQQMDGFSLQLATMGGFGLDRPFLCNGANLAYKKEAFNALDGFVNNNHIASGDDIFIMDKIKRSFPGKLEYLKSQDAIVTTQSVKSWKEVIKQRIRWASKTTKQKEFSSKALGILIFLTNSLLLAGAIWILFEKEYTSLFLTFVVLKVGIDVIVLNLAANFFGRKLNPIMFLMSSLLYPFISVIVVFGSFIGTYEWKGRKFEKNP